MKILPEPLFFEWDKGNIDKNLKKHGVSNQEAEEVFRNKPVYILEDIKHSLKEKRYMLWGVTNEKRKLTIIFCFRNDKIRIISARDMNRKERRLYEEKTQANPQI